ncbi:MAG: MgtC/SapB family protein [Lachnospiraceae bacterium]|nr:MgtC/SapB family protein [Lachnospiraceae bacterium]
MLSVLNGLRNVDLLGCVMRIIVACFCGTLIGLERSAKNRPAGFRTHILVCLGAAMAAMTGLYIYLVMELPTDIARISAQVISGLGFIGAGTIIITKKRTIKGLTTAAGLWTTGIIGLAIGSGYYELGIIGTAMVLLTETYLAKLGRLIQQSPEYIIEVHYNEKDTLDEVMRHCKDNRMSIVNLQIESLENDPDANYVSVIKVRGNMKSSELLRRLGGIAGIVTVETQ